MFHIRRSTKKSQEIKIILVVLIIICIPAGYPIICNRIAYKELCNLEQNEKMSIDSKLARMKIYALDSQHSFRSYTYLKKYDELLHKFKEESCRNKPMGKFFTIISYGMANEPTIVYDNTTLVMYAVSKSKDESGSFTMLVNSDGSPRTYDKNIEE